MATETKTYRLEIGSEHAPYPATDEEYDLQTAQRMANALHHPDWPRGRCIIIRSIQTGRAVGYTERMNGRTEIRPA